MRPERLIAVVLVMAGTVIVVVAVWLLQRSPEPPPAPEASGGPPAGAEAGSVVHVSDGDTVIVEVGGVQERVRLIGLDAPEIAHPEEGTPAECGGDAARAATSALVAGLDVRLEREVSDRDRFGRLLRHVWVQSSAGWLLVGEELVEDGAVEARSYPPDTARDEQLDAAERRARQAGVGIWATC